MKNLLLLGLVFVLVPALQASAQNWSLTGNAISSGNFLGTTNNEDLELRTNNVLGFRISPGFLGAPNVIGGDAANNLGTFGGVRGATIGGGGQSNAPNQAAVSFATVGGGFSNTARGYAATIGGGGNNTASGFLATVPGGTSNTASGDYSFAAGNGSTASNYSSFAMGTLNIASGYYSFAVGHDNRASGWSSFALGDHATANHDGSFVWSDSSGSFASTRDNQFLIRASNGVGIGTNDPRNQLHVQSTYSTSPQVRLSDPTTASFAQIGSGTGGLAITTGAGTERLRILHSNGRVGIGTTAPSEQLHVVGNVRATGLFLRSTVQEKKSVNKFNEQDYTHALQKLSQLDAVTFLYRDEPDNHQPHIGIIAEDSPQEILNDKGDAISIYAYTTLLLAGLKAQQAEIEQLKSDLKNLQHMRETGQPRH